MTVPEECEGQVNALSGQLIDVVITNNDDDIPAQESESTSDDEFSKSGSPSSTLSQLEQLANTNLLTIRIKWDDRSLIDYKKSELLTRIHEYIQIKRGIPINPSIIENYEYLADWKRLSTLRENHEIYTYEMGNEEFTKSYDDDDSGSWLYDLVIQAQFKSWQDLEAVRDSILKSLAECSIVDRYSISVNPHALTHPGNLYIRGIPKDLTVDDLVPVFSKFGPVLSLKIICHPSTGQSLGYGFISFPLGSQAALCIKELNGNLMNSSPLFINYHVERKERERIHWDHVKEDNDDERFRGIFIGNLPTNDASGELLTPEGVITKFKQELNDGEDGEQKEYEIVSYCFPKRNSKSHIEYKDEDDMRDNVETCESQYEESPLRGYGFIKFSTHDQALKAIEKCRELEWSGNKLIVNKAVQAKSNNHHHNNHNHRNHTRRYSDRSSSSRQSSLSNVPFYPQFGAPHTGFAFFSPPASGIPIPSISNGDIPVHELEQSPSSSPSPQALPSFMTHPGGMHGGPGPQQIFGGPPSLSNTPESSTAPSSRSGSLFNVPHHIAGMIPPPSAYGLPIPTRDQQESNLYIKHLPFSWKDRDLYQFYEKFGEIISAKIITVGGSKNEDNISSDSTGKSKKQDELPLGTSKGYGFVCFKNPLDASRAMMATDRFQIDENHTLYVSFAQKRAKSVSNQGSSAQYSKQHSRKGSFHHKNNSFNGDSDGTPMMNNYNPKFLNAMFQQQGGHTYHHHSRPRGSWPIPMLANGLPIAPHPGAHGGPPGRFMVPFVPMPAPIKQQEYPTQVSVEFEEKEVPGGPLDVAIREDALQEE